MRVNFKYNLASYIPNVLLFIRRIDETGKAVSTQTNKAEYADYIRNRRGPDASDSLDEQSNNTNSQRRH